LVKGQSVLDGRGGIVETPNIKIDRVRFGKFYRPMSDDTDIGFRWEIGSAGSPTVLYPVQINPKIYQR